MGAFYELEQMFAASNKTGTELKEFATLTGMSTKAVQEYNAAITKATGQNVDLKDTISEFTTLQHAIRDVQFGGGDIVGPLGKMFSALGGNSANPNDLKKWITDLPKLLQEAQRFAQLPNIGATYKEMVLSGLHLSPVTISAMMQPGGGLTSDKIAAMSKYVLSDDYINRIKEGSAAWAMMFKQLNLAMAKFTAVDGAKLAKNLEPLIESVIRLVTALTHLAEHTGVFGLLGKSMMGWSMTIDHILAGLDKINKNKGENDYVFRALMDPRRVHLGPKMGGRAQEEINLRKEYQSLTVVVKSDEKDAYRQGQQVGRGVQDSTALARSK